MKCQRCQDSLGKDVNMEALGAGQYQCPDCRAVVVPAPAVADPLPVTAPPPAPKATTRKP